MSESDGAGTQFTALLESVFIVFSLLLLAGTGTGLYAAFTAPDVSAVNTFEELHQNINYLINQPSSQELLIRYEFSNPLIDGFHAENRRDFKGTIFAVDLAGTSGSAGTVSQPFPYAGRDNVNVLADLQRARSLLPADISVECDGKPCLCYSKHVLSELENVEMRLRVLTSPDVCKSFDVPDNVSIVRFQFRQFLTVFEDDSTVEIKLRSEARDGETTIHMHLEEVTLS